MIITIPNGEISLNSCVLDTVYHIYFMFQTISYLAKNTFLTKDTGETKLER